MPFLTSCYNIYFYAADFYIFEECLRPKLTHLVYTHVRTFMWFIIRNENSIISLNPDLFISNCRFYRKHKDHLMLILTNLMKLNKNLQVNKLKKRTLCVKLRLLRNLF